MIIEETFPLKCSIDDLKRFLADIEEHAAGWVSFYWGMTSREYEKPVSCRTRSLPNT
ncbi:MAG: hypothetical protein ACI8T1_003197 [Verrucomicrobiales bacterium]